MSFWDDHGTKVLGAVTAVTGAVQGVLPALAGLLAPGTYQWVQLGVAVLTGLFGVSTVKRGFTNSANAPQSGP